MSTTEIEKVAPVATKAASKPRAAKPKADPKPVAAKIKAPARRRPPKGYIHNIDIEPGTRIQSVHRATSWAGPDAIDVVKERTFDEKSGSLRWVVTREGYAKIKKAEWKGTVPADGLSRLIEA